MTAAPAEDISLYHGLIEITADYIRMTPNVDPPELREQILVDFLITATTSDWRDADGHPAMLSPSQALEWLAEGTYEAIRDYDEAEAAVALAREALTDDPYTAVRYALSLRRECLGEDQYSALLTCETEPVAFRVGAVWREPCGAQLTDERLNALLITAKI